MKFLFKILCSLLIIFASNHSYAIKLIFPLDANKPIEVLDQYTANQVRLFRPKVVNMPGLNTVLGWYDYQLKDPITNKFLSEYKENKFFKVHNVVIVPNGDLHVIEVIDNDIIKTCELKSPCGENDFYTWSADRLRAFEDNEKFMTSAFINEVYDLHTKYMDYKKAPTNSLIQLQITKPFVRAKIPNIEYITNEDKKVDLWEYVQTFTKDAIHESERSFQTYAENESLRTVEDKILISMLKAEAGSVRLLSEPGVGKSFLIERLVTRFKNADVPFELQNALILTFSASSLNNSKYVGSSGNKAQALVKLAEYVNLICIVDEAHALADVGKSASSETNVLQDLKPALASGRLKMIGVSTRDEWVQAFSKDPAFNRRFSEVSLEEPKGEDLVRIIKNWIKKFNFPKISDELILEAIKLSDSLSTDAYQPARATALLDQVLAIRKFKSQGQSNISLEELRIAAHQKYGVDPSELSFESRKKKIEQLEIEFRNLLGQEDAKAAIITKAKSITEGLQDSERPRYLFLLAGPEGQGKTEIVTLFAKAMNLPSEHRIMMSAFSKPESVDKFKRLVAKYIQRNPFTVLFFDEVEKAHPSVQNATLDMLDKGRFTYFESEQSDKSIHIRLNHTSVFLATNAGTKYLKQYNRDEFNERDFKISLIEDKIESPLLDRISRIIPFYYLNEKQFSEVIRIKINKTLKDVEKNSIGKTKVNISAEDLEKMIEHLTKQHFKKRMSNREALRAIENGLIDVITLALYHSNENRDSISFTYCAKNLLKIL